MHGKPGKRLLQTRKRSSGVPRVPPILVSMRGYDRMREKSSRLQFKAFESLYRASCEPKERKGKATSVLIFAQEIGERSGATKESEYAGRSTNANNERHQRARRLETKRNDRSSSSEKEGDYAHDTWGGPIRLIPRKLSRHKAASSRRSFHARRFAFIRPRSFFSSLPAKCIPSHIH